MPKKKFNFIEWLEEWVHPEDPETWICVLPQDGGILLTCSCGECIQAYGDTLQAACAAYEQTLLEILGEDEEEENYGAEGDWRDDGDDGEDEENLNE